jgi:hypothetical protein
VNKSLHATNDLIGRCLPQEYNIIAIQEPYLDFLGKAQANPHWYMIYPRTYYSDKEKRTRSMILINRSITTDTWAALYIGHPDVTGIEVKTHASVVLIFNFYCNSTHSQSIHYAQDQTGRWVRMGSNQNKEKANMLFKTFFPPPSRETHNAAQSDYEYPPPAFSFEDITDEQIQ